MRSLLIICLSFCYLSAIGQYIPDENSSSEEEEKESPVIRAPWADKPPSEVRELPADASEKEAVAYTIETLFDYMREANGSAIKGLFTPDAALMSTTTTNGRPAIRNTSVTDFASRIGQATAGDLDERITSMEVRIDENLATAWVGYDFYYRGEFHHCGYDAVQLHKGTSGWKIMQLADTQRKNCVNPSAEIDQVMDQWHQDASRANAKGYFEAIAQDGIFLGTDESENWTKDEFYTFAKPFFDKGRVWDFKVKERNVFFSQDKSISWFNEVLDTWMGPCRGSGVLSQDQSGQWQLKQYNLTMLIPNDIVQDYLALRKEKGK